MMTLVSVVLLQLSVWLVEETFERAEAGDEFSSSSVAVSPELLCKLLLPGLLGQPSLGPKSPRASKLLKLFFRLLVERLIT